MKKWEACAALHEIAEYHRRCRKTYETDPVPTEAMPEGSALLEGMKKYYAEEKATTERWLAALDMAGTALTR